MNIYLNNEVIAHSGSQLNLKDLLEIQGVKSDGTAVTVNDRLIRHSDWECYELKDGDRVTVISAAFGG